MCPDNLDGCQRLLHFIFVYTEISFFQPSFLQQMHLQICKKSIPYFCVFWRTWFPGFINVISGFIVFITETVTPWDWRINGNSFINSRLYCKTDILVKNAVVK